MTTIIKVVSDSTPLIALARINRFDLGAVLLISQKKISIYFNKL
jgi:hypothetical protein